MEARLGFTHKFDDKVQGKVKVNHLGHLNALLKLKLSDTTSAILTSGLNLRSIPEQKSKPLPLGFMFDIKL